MRQVLQLTLLFVLMLVLGVSATLNGGASTRRGMMNATDINAIGTNTRPSA